MNLENSIRLISISALLMLGFLLSTYAFSNNGEPLMDIQLQQQLLSSGAFTAGAQNMQIRSSIGQVVIGQSSGENYRVTSGFIPTDSDVIFRNNFENNN